MSSIRLFAVMCCAAAAAFAQVPHACDVRSEGAVGDGKTLDTPAIQRTVDRCAAAGGGTVYVAPGRYLSGTVLLRDGITLSLDAGATIVGTPELSQYTTAIEGQVWYDALILAKGVHHVAILGRGALDGGKVRNPQGEERMRGPHIALFMEANGRFCRLIKRGPTAKDMISCGPEAPLQLGWPMPGSIWGGRPAIRSSSVSAKQI